MEPIISNMLSRFESGTLSRRELVSGLALLAGASQAGAQGAEPATRGTKIDHTSIQVTNLPRSIAFYQTIFGFTIIGEDKPNEIVRMGSNGKVLVSLHHKSPTGIVDHFAIGVEKFNKDAVTKELKTRGIEAKENLDYGYYIVDPEGINVQIVAG